MGNPCMSKQSVEKAPPHLLSQKIGVNFVVKEYEQQAQYLEHPSKQLQSAKDKMSITGNNLARANYQLTKAKRDYNIAEVAHRVAAGIHALAQQKAEKSAKDAQEALEALEKCKIETAEASEKQIKTAEQLANASAELQAASADLAAAVISEASDFWIPFVGEANSMWVRKALDVEVNATTAENEAAASQIQALSNYQLQVQAQTICQKKNTDLQQQAFIDQRSCESANKALKDAQTSLDKARKVLTKSKAQVERSLKAHTDAANYYRSLLYQILDKSKIRTSQLSTQEMSIESRQMPFSQAEDQNKEPAGIILEREEAEEEQHQDQPSVSEHEVSEAHYVDSGDNRDAPPPVGLGIEKDVNQERRNAVRGKQSEQERVM